eukprot:scaffold5206_cov78-Skeletonema_dohrnii-CCMP3373.AAC.4
MSYREKNAKVERAFAGLHGGMLVIADTKAQVQKALRGIEHYREKNPGGKFTLVVDEADAMFRTEDRRQVFEQALEELRATNPTMTVMISATPVPFMLEIAAKEETNGEDIEFINFAPNSNYLGVEDIAPLIDRDGKKVYLQQNELTSVGHVFDGTRIPYANPKVKALYDDALGHEKGVLLLDASSPRVYADNNIYQKAKAVQALYHKKGIPLIAVTISGRGIHVRLPPGLEAIGKMIDLPEDSKMADDWEFSLTSSKFQKWRNNLIGDLLNCLDAAFGLSVPIFVFGYTKMRRGISFRSDKRVVTHMLMNLGRGHHTSSAIQTLGRATGNCRDVLDSNGYDCVTVLTTINDLTVCIKMQNYINEIGRRIGKGDTFLQAMTGATEKMPDDSNFVRHTFREIGPIKGGRKLIQDAFVQEIAWGSLEDNTREKYWEDTNAQQLMRSIVRLNSAHKYFDPDDIKHELRECANYPMTKSSILQLLRKFVDDCLVKKTQNHVGGTDRIGGARESPEFQVAQNVNWLCKFMNPNKGEVPNEEDLQCSFEEESIVSNVESDDSCWEEVANSAANLSVSNTPDGSKEESPNRVFDSDEQSVSSMSLSTAVYSGRNSSTAATISPEKLGNAMTAKRKALAVFQSKSSEKRKKRKKRVPYSEEEKDALLQGVEEFGEGKWKKIRNHYADTFDLNMRTPVNLKDLYRTLTK